MSARDRAREDIKKYVVSRSSDVDTSWPGSMLLREIADVRRLKQEDGPNLVVELSCRVPAVDEQNRTSDVGSAI